MAPNLRYPRLAAGLTRLLWRAITHGFSSSCQGCFLPSSPGPGRSALAPAPDLWAWEDCSARSSRPAWQLSVTGEGGSGASPDLRSRRSAIDLKAEVPRDFDRSTLRAGGVDRAGRQRFLTRCGPVTATTRSRSKGLWTTSRPASAAILVDRAEAI